MNNAQDNKLQAGDAEPVVASPLTDEQFVTKLNKTILNKFNFNLDKGYYLADCRKSPPKRINAKPFRSLDQALDFVAGRIKKEFIDNTEMYKKLNGRFK